MKTIVLCGENPCRDVKFYYPFRKFGDRQGILARNDQT
jgi:hypothetical protein